jgi:cell division septation protein DedD
MTLPPAPRSSRPSASFRRGLRRLVPAASFVAAALASCGPRAPADVARAADDYRAGRHEAALQAARASAAGASGIALDRARYLEGLALLSLGRPADAVAPLREASDASDRSLAADALVSLGTAQIRLEDFDAAARSYRQAAERLDGAEARRAHDIAARCYDRAGLSVAADAERRLASAHDTGGSTPAGAPASGNPGAAPVAASTAPAQASSTPSSPTARIVNGVEIEPVRFAVQAGAFSERARADDLARSIAGAARKAGLPAPRIARKERGGDTLFVVQLGDFASRVDAGRALGALRIAGCTVERALPAVR